MWPVGTAQGPGLTHCWADVGGTSSRPGRRENTGTSALLSRDASQGSDALGDTQFHLGREIWGRASSVQGADLGAVSAWRREGNPQDGRKRATGMASTLVDGRVTSS